MSTTVTQEPAKKPYVRRYTKGAVKTNPQQVASYTARKKYPGYIQELSPIADCLVDQILNPEDTNDVERWPNTYGLSSVYKCKTIFSAKFDENGRSCVSVSPNIKDSIFTTWGSQSSVPLQQFGSSSSRSAPYSFQDVVLDSVNLTVEWAAPLICNNGQALLPFPCATASKLLYPIKFDIDGGTGVINSRILFYLEFTNAITVQSLYHMTLYDSNYVEIYTRSGVGNQGFNELTVWNSSDDDPSDLANIRYFSLTLVGLNLPYRGPVITWFNMIGNPDATANLILPNHCQHVGIYDIKDADTIRESASQAFVLAQSLLITSEMSDINNGGMLAVARVPANNPIGLDGVNSGSSIVANNWYEWLSSMPNNNYDGPVKDGGYGFYLAEDETGYFYRPVDNFFAKNLPYMAAEFTTTADLLESAVVRIKISTIVQFTTTSSIYDQRPSSYYSDMALAQHILSLVPACYSNDGHREGLKKFLKAAGIRVKTLLKNPRTYQTAAKILQTLAPLIL